MKNMKYIVSFIISVAVLSAMIVTTKGESFKEDMDSKNVNSESGNTENGNMVSGDTESENTEGGNTESENTVSENTVSENTENANTVSENTENTNTENGNTNGGNSYIKAEEQPEPDIVAPSAVLIDAKTGLVIYDKNKDMKSYPASVTKIMTALLTLEEYEDDLDKVIEFSHEAVYSIPPGSSHIAMNEGETLTVEQSLYGLMLASANEVANALAEDISGNNEAFALEMTARAKELGAVNTNFANPDGLHDDNHYTTAFDMALIMKEAIKHPEFVKVISTEHYEIPPTEKQPEIRGLNNSDKMVLPGSAYYMEEVVGGKTGYTEEAQNTLATYAKQGETQLIAVVMKDQGSEAYTDTEKLLDYGFSMYENVEVFSNEGFSEKIAVVDEKGEATGGYVEVVAKDSLEVNLSKKLVSDLELDIELPQVVAEGVVAGDTLGKVAVTAGGVLLGDVDLVAKSVAGGSVAPIEEQESGVVKNNLNLEMGGIINPGSSFEEVPWEVVIGVSVAVTFLIMTLGMFLKFRRMKTRRTRKYQLQKAAKTTYRYKG